MPRQIGSEWQDFVPSAYGIRASLLDGTDPNPVTVEIRPLTAKQARTYERITVLKFRKSGEIDASNAEEVAKRIFTDNVRNVRNYSDRDGHPIESGEDLWDRGEQELVAEVNAAIKNLSELEAGRLDRLRSRSAGSPPATNP